MRATDVDVDARASEDARESALDMMVARATRESPCDSSRRASHSDSSLSFQFNVRAGGDARARVPRARATVGNDDDDGDVDERDARAGVRAGARAGGERDVGVPVNHERGARASVEFARARGGRRVVVEGDGDARGGVVSRVGDGDETRVDDDGARGSVGG